MSPRAAVAWGLFCALLGGVLILGSLGVLELNKAEGVPDWVVGCVGLMFVLAGAAIVNGYVLGGGVGPDGDLPRGAPLVVRLTQYMLGLGVVGLMTAVFGWIAFGPGERQFSTTLSLPFLTRSGAGGQLGGRLLFGIVAVGMLAFFVAFAIHSARRLGLGPRRRARR